MIAVEKVTEQIPKGSAADMREISEPFIRGKRIDWKAFAPLNDRTLINANHKIGVIWSAKCACTKVVLWYFKLTNLLHAAMFFHPFAHQYRRKVLYSSQHYVRWMRTSNWRSFSWYQFCRDPVKRALSAYRHNIGYGYADDRISRVLGKNVSHLEGYSLDQFLDYLEGQDLSKAEQHVQFQWQPISRDVDVKIINIDETDMLEEMNMIEKELGLPVTDFAASKLFHRDDLRRANFVPRQGYSSADVLSKTDAEGMWPVDTSALASATIERIKRIYARDMQFIYGGGAGIPKRRRSQSPKEDVASAASARA